MNYPEELNCTPQLALHYFEHPQTQNWHPRCWCTKHQTSPAFSFKDMENSVPEMQQIFLFTALIIRLTHVILSKELKSQPNSTEIPRDIVLTVC